MKKILIIQLRQLGDILLTTPVVREIREEYPYSQIYFLSHNMGKRILQDCPYLDVHWTYQDDFGLLDWLLLLKEIWHTKFDVVLDFMNNPRSAMLTLVAGKGARRIAFESRRRAFYNVRIPKLENPGYIVKEKFTLVNAMGAQPQNQALVLPWFQKDLAGWHQLHRQMQTAGHHGIIVCLSPTHRRVPRRWPQKSYAQLADFLVDSWGAWVVWLWGPDEEGYVLECREMCLKTTHMGPKTSFRELAALVANCDLFVGNSNGPSHVAVAVETPSLQIHGPTKAGSWCPNLGKHQSVQSPAPQAKNAAALLEVNGVWQKLVSMRHWVYSSLNERQRFGPKNHWNTLRKELDCRSKDK